MSAVTRQPSNNAVGPIEAENLAAGKFGAKFGGGEGSLGRLETLEQVHTGNIKL